MLSSQSLKWLAKNSYDRVESYVFRYENGKIQEDSFLIETDLFWQKGPAKNRNYTFWASTFRKISLGTKSKS